MMNNNKKHNVSRSVNVRTDAGKLLESLKDILLHNPPLKMSSLIENLEIEQILLLLSLFSIILDSKSNDENLDFNNVLVVGIYKAGSFLAHFLNLICQANTKNELIILFQSNPYATLVPRFKDSKFRKFLSNKEDILVLDESVKTGFTFTLFENLFYRKTGINLKSKKLELWTIFNYKNFSESAKKLIGTETKIRSLYDVIGNKGPENNMINLNKRVKKLLDGNKKTIDSKYTKIKEIYYKYLNSIERIQIDDFSKSIKKVGDLSVIFSHTDCLYYIALNFANEIIKIIGNPNENRKDVFLFSSTAEGQILSLFVAFILKLMISKKREYSTKVYLDFPKNIHSATEEQKFFNDTLKFLIEPSFISQRYYEIIFQERMGRAFREDKVFIENANFSIFNFDKILLVKDSSCLIGLGDENTKKEKIYSLITH